MPTAPDLPPPSDRPQWTVLYDRDCGFCRWSLGVVLRAERDARLRPVALQSAEADALLSELTPEQRMASWHLISPAGRRRSAGAALPALLALLRGGALPARVLSHTPELNERGYRWVAAHRSWFSRATPSSAKRRADAIIADRQAHMT
jgi:predicted DCC family thiol-disulfide oxidoreductase YuxK